MAKLYMLLAYLLIVGFLLPAGASADAPPGNWQPGPSFELLEASGESPRSGGLQSFISLDFPAEASPYGPNGIFPNALGAVLSVDPICSSGISKFGGTRQAWAFPVATPGNDPFSLLSLDIFDASPAAAVLLIWGASLGDGSSASRSLCDGSIEANEGVGVFWVRLQQNQSFDQGRQQFRVGDLATCGLAPDFTGTWAAQLAAGNVPALGSCQFFAVFSGNQL